MDDLLSRKGKVKPVVLTFVRYYLPGYKSGGPIRTISNMVDALGDEVEFKIVTSDRDATDQVPYQFLAGRVGWQKVGKANVLYLSREERSLGSIVRIIRQSPHDTLYLNSFFDPDFTLKPLVARHLGFIPTRGCVIAPRGELSPGALNLKAWKKRLFLSLARATGMYEGLVWQASSLHESGDIKTILGSRAARIQIASNIGSSLDMSVGGLQRAENAPLRLVFLSRISPMKNLEFALEVLQSVSVPVILDIYGPIRDEAYWKMCKGVMGCLPPHITATYKGAVEPDRVSHVLSEYDLFFLPTRGENFGHAILEALAVGTPVLIADTTPWRDLEISGVGWDLPLSNPITFAEKINELEALSAFDYLEMRRRVSAFAEKRRLDPEVFSSNKKLFLEK